VTEARETNMIRSSKGKTDAIRVVMLDLLSFVPYYTGHLCAALRQSDEIRVALASITYSYDPGFFRRLGIRNNSGLVDLAFRIRHGGQLLRRAAKLVEYGLNLTSILIRLIWSRPHVMHVQFLPLASYGLSIEAWILRLVRACGIRVVYTVHNVLPQDSQTRHRAVYRVMYRLADRLVCHDSGAAARLISEFAVNERRISVIPHGPMFERERHAEAGEARAQLGFTGDQCIVLWQGILRPYKGVSFLLKAWQQVCAKESRARLAIVGTGDPELLRAVEAEVQSLEIEGRVHLELRFVSVEELDGYHEAADVLVYPYSEITTSGALLTGIVRGKAIVATALPAFEQILRHDNTALLVPYGDVAALSATLLRLIRHPELRAQMGERLRRSQAGIASWSEIAEQTRECYRTAVSEAQYERGFDRKTEYAKFLAQASRR